MCESEPHITAIQPFLAKANSAFTDLFEKAREVDELQFALSLAPEFRPYTDTTTNEAERAFEDYSTFLSTHSGERIHIRIALAFYCHIAEASGFWEVPKNLLRLLEGRYYDVLPFSEFSRIHAPSGQRIAPNANRILASLVGASESLGLKALSEVFIEAFDPDLRNGFAHADYTMGSEGIRVQARSGASRLIDWDEFNILLYKGINTHCELRSVVDTFIQSYTTPKIVQGKLNSKAPIQSCELHYDVAESQFTIKSLP